MKIQLFKNKKGVTILEGLVAMGILAMVAVGVFGVVLSISRKSTQPDIREEMVYAVEQAYRDLQMYTSTDPTYPLSPTDPPCICEQTGCSEKNPLFADADPRDISCRLPHLCDPNQSSFTYTVQSQDTFPYTGLSLNESNNMVTAGLNRYTINFSITCNGFKL